MRLSPAISFAAQQTFEFANYSRSVAVADYNGDGRADLAVTNTTSSAALVSLNTTAVGAGAISLGPLQTLPAAGFATSATAADFNGDGRPDLVITDDGVGRVSVFLNATPTGAAAVSFALPQTFAVTNCDSLVVADVNGDGKPDLVVTDSYNGKIGVLLNTTAAGAAIPTFAAEQTFNLSGATSVAAGDINGDGKPDLAVTLSGSKTVAVLLNTTATGSATVTFAAAQTFATGTTPHEVTVADLNGDGKPDLALTNSGDNTVSVLVNQTASGAASASFAAQQTFAVGNGPIGIAAADLDGDGKPDLAVVNYGDHSVSVLQNQTAAGAATVTLAAQQTFAVAAGLPQLVSVGDFNGDGRPDLVVASNTNASTVSLLLNTTVAAPVAYTQPVAVIQSQAQTLTLTGIAPNGDPLTFALTSNPSHGTLSGFNGSTGQVTYTPTATYTGPDSFQFTVTDTATNQTSAAAAVSLTVAAAVSNPPPIRFAAQQTFAAGSHPPSVAAADLNGDGKPDLIVANGYDSAVQVSLNTTPAGAATASFAARQTFAVNYTPTFVTTADVNGDGKPDLIVAESGSSKVAVFLNTTPAGAATVTFAPRQDIQVGNSPDVLAIADVNGDGKPDLIVDNTYYGTVAVVLNTTPAGAATASFAAPKNFGSGAYSVGVGDVNGDGRPDLVYSNYSPYYGEAFVLLNTTPAGAATPSFSAPQGFAVGTNPIGVALADVNGDGKPDLVVGNNYFGTVSVLLNTTLTGAAAASFSTQQTYAVGDGPEGLVVADLNGDGRPDVAVANNRNGSDSVSVLQNQTPTGSAFSSFAAQQTFGIGYLAELMTTADFNGDGRPDLAVANWGDNSVSVLLNTTVTANPQTLTVPQGRATALTLTGTGSANGDTLKYTLTANPSHGTLSGFNGATGQVTYTSDATYTGADSFQFTVTDTTTNVTSAAAPVSLTVLVPPTANPEAVTVARGQTTILTLFGSAPNGDPLTVTVTAAPAHGTFTGFNATTHQGLYTSSPTYTGPDSFQFTVTDTTTTLTSTATVSITVAAAPVANAQPVTVSLDRAQVITLTGSAPQNDPLTFAVASLPAHGTLSGFNSATGQVTYTPNPGYLGTDGFQFAVTDTTTGLTGAATVSLTVSANAVSAVVGQFGGQGVWQYNRATGVWTQLTAANASVLAADPFGDVAGVFPGQGVWEYTPAAGWKQRTGIDATLLAMDALGDIVAEFPRYGVDQYQPGVGWRSLTAANASLLAVDAQGDVAAEFPGYGVWEFLQTTGWRQINGVDVTLLAMGAAGEVVANFHGYGVAEFTSPGAWAVLNGNQASALAVDGQGDVTAEFAGVGVGEYVAGSGWSLLTAANAALLAAQAGDVFGAFPGHGLWEYDPGRGWFQLTAADAALLAVA